MAEGDEARFRQLIEPHFEAGYNLARWLSGNDADAADILQDASFKAFQHLGDMKSDRSRAWFLQIVRNTSYTALKSRKLSVDMDPESELEHASPSVEDALMAKKSAQELREALEDLDVPHREILILREIEELSYEEVADVLQIPLGTVMSRLARARNLLKKKLSVKGVVL